MLLVGCSAVRWPISILRKQPEPARGCCSAAWHRICVPARVKSRCEDSEIRSTRAARVGDMIAQDSAPPMLASARILVVNIVLLIICPDARISLKDTTLISATTS